MNLDVKRSLRSHDHIEIDTLVVKVASRCNINCDYCYIYHAKDSSWRDMPATMSKVVMQALVAQVANLYDSQNTPPHVVFHGGEPLLVGIRILRDLVAALVKRVPAVSLSIQSNATTYTHELEKLLLDYRANLTFSLSVDGFQHEHDRHRLGIRGQSVYAKIESTMRRSQQAGVLDNILMVVDIKNDPRRIHEFMATAGTSSYNIILQDGDHLSLPAGKAAVESNDVGAWLWELFTRYSSGPQRFRIKFFDDIAVALLKKNRAIRGPYATYAVCTMTVDTDGEIKQSDTFRVNGDGADRVGALNVMQVALTDVTNSVAHREHLARIQALPVTCTNCAYLDTCGGGYPQHRFGENGYDNPSVYCSDYMFLFGRMEGAICR